MPRFSFRQQLLKRLRFLQRFSNLRRVCYRLCREVLDIPDDGAERAELIRFISLSMGWLYLRASRYSYRPAYRPVIVYSDHTVWRNIVYSTSVYNEEEFLMWFRVDRRYFIELVDLIKGHPVFNGNEAYQRRHFSPELHLLITLKYFGNDGNGGSALKVKDALGVSKGAVEFYVNRTVKAILSLESVAFFWPDDTERREISARIREKHHFPCCVGLMDGTHLGLAVKPEANGEEYFTRKSQYAITALIIVDDLRRIRFASIGWPGSVHDNRVWRNTNVFLNPDNFFTESQYLLGDSAFTNSRIVISSYKKVAGRILSQGQIWFNDLLAKPRSGVEDVIGIWKGRFPFLRNIRIKIKNRRCMVRLIRRVKASIILHNVLVKAPIDDDWLNDEEDEEDDVDGEAMFRNNAVAHRREEVHNYLHHLLT